MLAIGRGLMTNPDCLIMDEPSEGLAPIIIQGVWEAIGKLKAQGMSILLVEQNAHLALKLVDYVHVMSKGQDRLFRPPGRTAGKRANQVQLSGHLTSLASSDALIARTAGTCWCVIRCGRGVRARKVRESRGSRAR